MFASLPIRWSMFIWFERIEPSKGTFPGKGALQQRELQELTLTLFEVNMVWGFHAAHLNWTKGANICKRDILLFDSISSTYLQHTFFGDKCICTCKHVIYLDIMHEWNRIHANILYTHCKHFQLNSHNLVYSCTRTISCRWLYVHKKIKTDKKRIFINTQQCLCYLEGVPHNNFTPKSIQSF